MTTNLTVTYDYLCPFARIANVALLELLASGADHEVTFSPFSLTQNHREEGEPAVWDSGQTGASGVPALLWSLAIRDGSPGAFAEFHRSVFDARHLHGADINDESVLRSIAADGGLDVDAVERLVTSGVPAKTLRDEHTSLVEDHGVFGVPTFISGNEAVFVRLMHPDPDDVARVIDMVAWDNLNEFKRTRIPR